MKILLDPLGGLYFDEAIKDWRFQKKAVCGTQADVLTVDVAYPVFDLMQTVGADVFSTRCLRKCRGERGETGQPACFESSYLYLRGQRLRPSMRVDREDPGVPEWVLNEGKTHLERDRNARLNYARFVRADLVVAFDITNYAVDRGLEASHNGRGDAEILADRILREAGKRTRRKAHGVRHVTDDDLPYAGLDMPVVVLNCGSAFDHTSSYLLRQPWYKEALSLGVVAGLWKHVRDAALRPQTQPTK